MHLSLLTGLALVLAAPAPKERAKDAQTLVGAWAVESSTRGGRPKAVPAGTTITFTADGKVTIDEGAGRRKEEATYKADPTKTLPEVEIVPPAEKGPAVLGIYKFGGDKLSFCFCKEGRPSEFASPEGSQNTRIVGKRIKKD